MLRTKRPLEPASGRCARRLTPLLVIAALASPGCGASGTIELDSAPGASPADAAGHGGDTGEPLTDAGDALTDPSCEVSDPFPSVLADESGLYEPSGTIEFLARDGNTLTAYTQRSDTFDERTGPIVFIMHGAGRNANGYLNAWRDRIDEHGALALAPEFPTSLYSGSESYNLGVGTDGTPSGATYDPEAWRDPSDYTHSEVEHLFDAVRTALGNESCRYLIYGHSAGGQFVHRLLTFRPDARVAKAVAANAGWYTLPRVGGGDDPNYVMPYGAQGAPPDPSRAERLFGHQLVVLLGENDVERDSNLRQNAQADFQGLTRFARGHFYYATGAAAARAEGLEFRWIVDTVPGVGHSNAGMSPAAADHFFGPSSR